MKEIIEAYETLLSEGEVSGNKEWQSTKISDGNPMVEVQNMHLLSTANYFDHHHPWAENHFKERIGGKALNPGNEYKNWPFWDISIDNHEKFKSSGKFDHTYMERFWRKRGNLNSVIGRIKRNNNTRQAWFSIWDPNIDHKDGIRIPCTLGYYFQLNTVSGNLDCNYIIRSCDAVRHLRNDLYMSWRLMEYIAAATDLKPGVLRTNIFNLHCFQSDLYYIKKYTEKCADIQ